MLQTLLFFHIIAAIGLFTGISIEVVAVVRVHRAQTLADVRAAVLNVPIVGPIMGLSVLLLLAMGISMIFVGQFDWNAVWINAVFALTILLAIVGPTVTGRKAEALHALAAQAGDGTVSAAVDAARRDRIFNYTVFLMVFELVAALYVMVAKPDLMPVLAVILTAAILAALPPAVLLRRTGDAPARP